MLPPGDTQPNPIQSQSTRVAQRPSQIGFFRSRSRIQISDLIFFRSRSQRSVWRSLSLPTSPSSAFTPPNSTSSSSTQKRTSGDHNGQSQEVDDEHSRKFLYLFEFDLYDNIWNAHRKLTMNTVKRPTVLAAAMPLMAATTVDATLCKGIGNYTPWYIYPYKKLLGNYLCKAIGKDWENMHQVSENVGRVYSLLRYCKG